MGRLPSQRNICTQVYRSAPRRSVCIVRGQGVEVGDVTTLGHGGAPSV